MCSQILQGIRCPSRVSAIGICMYLSEPSCVLLNRGFCAALSQNVKYDAVFEEDDPDAEDKHLLIGFDRKANLIEVLYNVIDEDRIRVFHAMKCRPAYIRLLRDRRER